MISTETVVKYTGLSIGMVSMALVVLVGFQTLDRYDARRLVRMQPPAHVCWLNGKLPAIKTRPNGEE